VQSARRVALCAPTRTEPPVVRSTRRGSLCLQTTHGKGNVMVMRFNHMELTVPKGTLTDERRQELTDFYGSIFGWETRDVEILGGRQFYMQPTEGQFILVAESSKPISAPGYDHLGLLMETREEVDHILEQCQRFRDKDDRVELKLYDDLHTGNTVVHAFYVRHLLPIWFDVQVLERQAGTAPAKSWQYV
jgi:hypothetical protein